MRGKVQTFENDGMARYPHIAESTEIPGLCFKVHMAHLIGENVDLLNMLKIVDCVGLVECILICLQ
jgi:hypothetical protein